jgi:hypothetical protein
MTAGWQLYERPGPGFRYSQPNPAVSITKQGQISLNRRAWEALEQPKTVDLLYDREAAIIGIRPATSDETAMRVHIPKNPAGSYVISGAGFLRYFGVEHAKAARYPARLDDDPQLPTQILVIDLRGNRQKDRP